MENLTLYICTIDIVNVITPRLCSVLNGQRTKYPCLALLPAEVPDQRRWLEDENRFHF